MSAVKNLEEVHQSIVREFLASCRASKLCVHCHSPARPVRQESHIKILHGRMPSSRVVRSMLLEKIKLAAFCSYCNVILCSLQLWCPVISSLGILKPIYWHKLLVLNVMV